MKVLGLDLGNRTLGMAISDFLGIIANPIGTMRFEDGDLGKALEYTKQAIKEYSVEKIVLGLPKNMNGTIGPQAEYCLTFKEMLEQETKLEVIMIDERLTSKQADVIMLSADLSRQKRKKNVFKVYLDSKGNNVTIHK